MGVTERKPYTIPVMTLRTYEDDRVEIQQWTLESIVEEINTGRSNQWTPYNKSDWKEGWDQWVDGEFYSRHFLRELYQLTQLEQSQVLSDEQKKKYSTIVEACNNSGFEIPFPYVI